jgi:AcrR family transcriptional regulator
MSSEGRWAVSAGPTLDGERPIGPRSRRGVQTRARLVDAAKEVFEEYGFLDARISDISARAGLSHGSFYHYFASKDEVFLEVVEAIEDRLAADSVIESGLLEPEPALSVRERLGESIRRYLVLYRDEARIMGVIEQVTRYHAQVQEARFTRARPYLKRAEEAIRRLQELGMADPALDPSVAAPALSAMVTGLAEMWLVQGRLESDFDHAVEQLTNICVKAFGMVDAPMPGSSG